MDTTPIHLAFDKFPWTETIAGSVAIVLCLLGVIHIIMLRKADSERHEEFISAIQRSYEFVKDSQTACHMVQNNSVKVMTEVVDELRESRAIRERHYELLKKLERKVS